MPPEAHDALRPSKAPAMTDLRVVLAGRKARDYRFFVVVLITMRVLSLRTKQHLVLLPPDRIYVLRHERCHRPLPPSRAQQTRLLRAFFISPSSGCAFVTVLSCADVEARRQGRLQLALIVDYAAAAAVCRTAPVCGIPRTT